MVLPGLPRHGRIPARQLVHLERRGAARNQRERVAGRGQGASGDAPGLVVRSIGADEGPDPLLVLIGEQRDRVFLVAAHVLALIDELGHFERRNAKRRVRVGRDDRERGRPLTSRRKSVEDGRDQRRDDEHDARADRRGRARRQACGRACGRGSRDGCLLDPPGRIVWEPLGELAVLLHGRFGVTLEIGNDRIVPVAAVARERGGRA